MTTNKDIIIEQLKDKNKNLAYENERMVDFLQALGLKPDDLVDYVINGNSEEVKMMIDYIIKNNI